MEQTSADDIDEEAAKLDNNSEVDNQCSFLLLIVQVNLKDQSRNSNSYIEKFN